MPDAQPTVATDWYDLARTGRNAWWRYVVGFVALIIGMTIGAGLYLVAVFFVPLVAAFRHQAPPPDFALGPVDRFVMVNISLVSAVPVLWLVLRFLHKRKFRTVLGAGSRLSWRSLASAAGWGGLQLALLLAAGLVGSEGLELQDDLGAFLRFLPLVLILTPLQAATEELIFRGYLGQAIGSAIPRPLVIAALTALPFAALHYQPGMTGWYYLYILSFGGFMMLLDAREQQLAPSIGIHTANNVLAFIFSASGGKALEGLPSLFRADDDGADLWSLLTFVAMATVFYAVRYRPWKRTA